jgi:hypothetical protein
MEYVIAQFVFKVKKLKGKDQTGVTGASPPTVTSMGGSFYSRWLIPREMSLIIWGSEGKGPRV